MKPNYDRTRRACFFAYLAMASVFTLPPLLFVTFHETYGISYTLLGTLILVNFFTQLTIDLIFTFFPKWFNIPLSTRLMPLLTSAGLTLYAFSPALFGERAYGGLVAGTILFSVSAGLNEVLISPLVAALPSEHPEKDMSLLHSLYGWGVVSVVLVSSAFFKLFGTEHWVILTLILAVFPLIASVFFFLSPIPDLNMQSDDGKKAAGRMGGIALCLLCIFLGSATENGMTNWISSYMETVLVLPKWVGDIFGMALFALLLAFCRVLYAKRGKNILNALFYSMIGSIVCYLVAGFARNTVLCFLACVLTGFFTSMLWPGTLILLEEKIPSPGVAAYALMAAGGDFGASVLPQAIGILTDKVAAASSAVSLSSDLSMTPEQLGLRLGIILSAIFPILGALLLLYMKKYFARRASGGGQ